MLRAVARPALLTALVALLGALVVVPATAAGKPPLRLPAHPHGLKAPVKVSKELDPVPRYQPQVSCQPGELAGLRKLRSLVLRTYKIGGAGNAARLCNEGTSEHADGRAWDWMVAVKNPKEKAAAADFIAWLTRDGGRAARRLGIMYVIYNQKIWGAYRAGDGWRPSYDHVDHVHISFSWNGARGNTSFWKGTVQPMDYGPCAVFKDQPGKIVDAPNPKPCPAAVALPRSSAYPTTRLGEQAASVKVAQRLLGVGQTGVFDAATRNAVLAFQKSHDVPWTGVLDETTWVALAPDKVSYDAVKDLGAAAARRLGLRSYDDAVLRPGSAGRAVLVLQKALGRDAHRRTGYFGRSLEAQVKATQKRLGLKPTGVWDANDWAALAR